MAGCVIFERGPGDIARVKVKYTKAALKVTVVFANKASNDWSRVSVLLDSDNDRSADYTMVANDTGTKITSTLYKDRTVKTKKKVKTTKKGKRLTMTVKSSAIKRPGRVRLAVGVADFSGITEAGDPGRHDSLPDVYFDELGTAWTKAVRRG